MHYHKSLFPVITLACCFTWILKPVHVVAESFKAQQWEITADKVTKFENPPSIIAEGKVILVKTEKITKEKKAGKKNNDWSDLLGANAEMPSVHSAQAPDDLLAVSKSVPIIYDDATALKNKQGKKKQVTLERVMTTIKADWMVYDMDLGTVKMRGNVFIDIGPDKLSATQGTVNLNRETGTFEDASVIRQYKDMHLEGRVIEKTGDMTYHIEDGWIITCKLKGNESPPWSFHAADADITDGGYAFLKHATFRVKNIPIFYTPIMILPAKRNRQTGFLFPLASLSDRNGFGIETPLFINLSPSSDITLYPHYLANRGFMAGADLRYMADESSKGALMGNFLADDLSDIDNPDNADYYADGFTHTNQSRYWLRGKADHDFGEWTSRVDFDFVSDKDYLTEFDSGRTGISISDKYFLDHFGRGLQDKTVDKRSNKLVTLRSWDNGTSFKASLKGFDDLNEGDSTALWKLPEFKYTGLMPIDEESGIDFSWDADYVNYWREEGVGAQRVDLYPKVSMAVPVMAQYLDTTIGVGLRDTIYMIDDNGAEEWQDSDTENRFLAEFETEVSTTLRKDFAPRTGQNQYWSHTLRPFIQYKYVTDDDQDKLPQFDAVDSYGDKNKITYGLKNFFYVTDSKSKQYAEREYGYLKIEQSYDLRNEADDIPFAPVEMRMAWYPTQALNLKYKTDIDVYDDGFLKHVVEGDYLNSRGDVLSFDYLFYNNLEAEDTSSIRLSAQFGLIYNFSAGYSLEQSLEDSIKIEEKFSIAYHPSCWSVELIAETTPDNEQVGIMFHLANIGTPFGVDFMTGD